MKRLGLIGGTSFPSTILYYSKLNNLYHRKFGGFHSCPLILYNIDYHEIKSRYHHGWSEIPVLLKAEFLKLMEARPDGIILCNNTLHKALDTFVHELPDNLRIFHIIELTKAYILQNHWKKILLLGTKFTMEDSFFKGPLIEAGVNVIIPDEQEREEIQSIQNRLADGFPEKEHIIYFQSLTEKYAYCDGIILGCTELPIVYEHVKSGPELINTIDLQCESALNFLSN